MLQQRMLYSTRYIYQQWYYYSILKCLHWVFRQLVINKLFTMVTRVYTVVLAETFRFSSVVIGWFILSGMEFDDLEAYIFKFPQDRPIYLYSVCKYENSHFKCCSLGKLYLTALFFDVLTSTEYSKTHGIIADVYALLESIVIYIDVIV